MNVLCLIINHVYLVLMTNNSEGNNYTREEVEKMVSLIKILCKKD